MKTIVGCDTGFFSVSSLVAHPSQPAKEAPMRSMSKIEARRARDRSMLPPSPIPLLAIAVFGSNALCLKRIPLQEKQKEINAHYIAAAARRESLSVRRKDANRHGKAKLAHSAARIK
jgi:hypothetical protein